MVEKWRAQMEALDLSGALETVWAFVRELNRLVEERAPWKLAKDETQARAARRDARRARRGPRRGRLRALAGDADDDARRSPATFGVTADELADWAWGIASGRDVRKPEPLFPRLEVAAG